MKTNTAVQISNYGQLSPHDIANLTRPLSYSLPPDITLRLVSAGTGNAVFTRLHGKEEDCCNRATD
jgi:hypothetical protein